MAIGLFLCLFLGKDMIKEVEINNNIKNLAERKAKELGILNNSILSGKGNTAGLVGELLVIEYMKAEREESYDFDLSKDGITYDVKTKQSSSQPELHYECSIAAYQKKQDCDRYVFVRVNLSSDVCWILGWINKDDFFDKARLISKGEIDESNGWEAKMDCYNLPISELNCMELLT